jgi:hypothetical protein
MLNIFKEIWYAIVDRKFFKIAKNAGFSKESFKYAFDEECDEWTTELNIDDQDPKSIVRHYLLLGASRRGLRGNPNKGINQAYNEIMSNIGVMISEYPDKIDLFKKYIKK